MKEFFKENKEVILPAALFLVVLIIFVRMVSNSFVYDDLLITFNWMIKTAVNPYYYFSQAKTLELYIPVQDVYRPLGVWFFSLEYRLFDLDPFYFHLISLFLHATNVILLFFLLKKILKNDVMSFVGSLIFALHPGTPETVAWAIQQYSLWSWFFSFLTLNLLFAEESSENVFLNKKWKKIVLLAFFSFSAVFFKEHAVILPLIYILCVLAFKMGVKKRLGEIIAVTLPVILYLALRGIVLGAYSQIEPWGIGRYKIFLTMLKGFVYYFRLLIWPHPLSINYDSFIYAESLSELPVIASAIFLFLLILSAIIFWRKRPLFSLGIFWIFIVMAPVSNFIFPTKQVISERYLYFMLPGFILAVSAIALFINEKKGKLKKILIPLSIFLVIPVFLIFSWLTFRRLGDWKNDLTLWKREIETKPDAWRTLSNYGISLEKENRTEEAIEHYKKILTLSQSKGSLSTSVYGLINAYIRIGEVRKAELLILDALKNIPGDNLLTFQLGKVYLEKKEYGKAKESFKSLVAKNNDDDISAFFAALSEKLDGGTDEEIKTEIKKIKSPIYRQAAFPLIKGRQKMLEDKYNEAIPFLEEALKMRPTVSITEPYLWLAECFEKTNEKEKALEIYRLTLTLNSSSIDAAQGILRNGGNKDEVFMPYF